MNDFVETVIRSFALIIVLFMLTKCLGKKQLAEMNVFEYISGVVLGSVAAIFSIDLSVPFLNGLASLFIWFLVPFLMKIITLKNTTIEQIVHGTPTMLIRNGTILKQNLQKEMLSEEELYASLRTQNIYDITHIKQAMLEPSGHITTLLNQPLQLSMNHPLGADTQDIPVIQHGQVFTHHLQRRNLNKSWLFKQLHLKKIDINHIRLALLQENNKLVVYLYQDGD